MPNYFIPNLKNACKILSFLKTQGRPLNITEISNNLKIPRTTTIRIMETMVSENFAFKEDGKYSLGSELISLGECACARVNVVDLSVKYLAKLTQQTGETSHLGVFSNNKVLIARVCESPQPLYATSRAGTIVEMHCSGTGKILLSELLKVEPNLVKKTKLKKRTHATITNMDEFIKELKQVSKNKYAVDNEEYHVGVRCLAAPIVDKTQTAIAAIGITAPAARFEKKLIPQIAKIVTQIADELSKELCKA